MIHRHEPSQALRFIRCTAAGETYCLRMLWIRGIRRIEELQQQQDISGVVGWIESDDGPIPVFCLAAQLHPSQEITPRSGKILVLNTSPRPWGMLVDDVDNVIQVETEALFPIPPMVGPLARAWFEGVVKLARDLELVLAPEGLQPETPTASSQPLLFDQTLDIIHSVASVSMERGSQRKILLFSTSPDSDFAFGLSLTQVPQIIQPLPILPLPGAVPHVLGIAEWRGVPLAIIDLSGFMGDTSAAVATDGRLLIVRVPTQRLCIGVPIQPQVSIRTLPLSHQLISGPTPLQESWIRGKFNLDNATLVIPDIDGMLVPSCESLV
jgi:chemotaxis signal transduction protein